MIFSYLQKITNFAARKPFVYKTMNTDIKEISVYDRDLDMFESQYPVPEGVTYNSFVILDEKPAIIDSVDERAYKEWRSNVESVLGGRQAAYLIIQHLEPDHSSQINWVMERFPECRILCTAMALKMLPQLTDCSAYMDRIDVKADGDTLSLGRHELTFITAQMVHWPEVMMVYDAKAKTLFSADGFGRFGAPDPTIPWACEGRRYYFNIIGKFGPQVQSVLKKLEGKEIDVIAPLHGPVLEGDLTEYLNLYRAWSAYEVETEGVFIAYGSIHGFTGVAAHKLEEILLAAGAPKVTVAELSRSDQSEAVEDAFRMSHLVIMSPTYDAEIFPPVHDFIHHLAIKGYRHRRVALVENGLWAPAAGRKMRAMFEQMKDITIVEPVITLRGRMTDENIAQLTSLAASLLEK